MDQPKGVSVRSYRDVVDSVERRIYRVDRWRLPTPHGVSVRALTYAAACLAALLVAAGLPLLGELLASLPASLTYLAVPAAGGWALASLSVDGRPPHHAAISALRFLVGPRTLAGLRRAPAVGSRLAAVRAVEIAPSGDEARYRTGEVRGPATLTLRYPAQVESVARWRLGRSGRNAEDLVVRRLGRARPLARGVRISVPAKARARFE